MRVAREVGRERMTARRAVRAYWPGVGCFELSAIMLALGHWRLDHWAALAASIVLVLGTAFATVFDAQARRPTALLVNLPASFAVFVTWVSICAL